VSDVTEPLRQLDGDRLRIEAGDRVRYCAAACPHRGGRLLYGRLDTSRNRLVCPLHRSTFDIRTGAVLAGPAESALWVGTDPAGEPSP
jgi:nitrite reductase/ring-hydroxylating ferredoxin subunit